MEAWEAGRGLGTSKTKPTCLITAWEQGWGEEQEEAEEEGSPTQEGEEEAAEGEEEEGHLSPQVGKNSTSAFIKLCSKK